MSKFKIWWLTKVLSMYTWIADAMQKDSDISYEEYKRARRYQQLTQLELTKCKTTPVINGRMK